MTLARPINVEMLLAYSIIFDESARLNCNARIARQLEQLADGCLQTALTIISESSPRYPLDA